MDTSQRPFTDIGIALARDARELGDSSRLLAEQRSGRMSRVRRGVYADAAAFEAAEPAARHRALARAADSQRTNAVFAGLTAAIIHRLPVLGTVPSEIQLLSSTSSGRRRNGTREFARRGSEATVDIDGLVVTSLEDTLIDVARREPLLTALAMADAALLVDRSGRRRGRCTFDALTSKSTEFSARPGSRKIEAVLRRVTTLAESPLESLSRWRLEQLGCPTPLLQRAVRLDSGRVAYLDFAWPELGLWGEADGAGKYRGRAPASPGALPPADVVIAEKRREDDIRRIMGWRCIRWGWSDAWDLHRFHTLLVRAGLPLTRHPSLAVRQFEPHRAV